MSRRARGMRQSAEDEPGWSLSDRVCFDSVLLEGRVRAELLRFLEEAADELEALSAGLGCRCEDVRRGVEQERFNNLYAALEALVGAERRPAVQRQLAALVARRLSGLVSFEAVDLSGLDLPEAYERVQAERLICELDSRQQVARLAEHLATTHPRLVTRTARGDCEFDIERLDGAQTRALIEFVRGLGSE